MVAALHLTEGYNKEMKNWDTFIPSSGSWCTWKES